MSFSSEIRRHYLALIFHNLHQVPTKYPHPLLLVIYSYSSCLQFFSPLWHRLHCCKYPNLDWESTVEFLRTGNHFLSFHCQSNCSHPILNLMFLLLIFRLRLSWITQKACNFIGASPSSSLHCSIGKKKSSLQTASHFNVFEGI